MGGWLCRHLFAAADWDHVVLLDRDPGIFAARFRLPLCGPHRRRPLRGRGRGVRGVRNDDRPLEGVRAGSASPSRSPSSRVSPPISSPSSTPTRSCSTPRRRRSSALATLRAVRHDVSVFGIHPLFGPTVKSMDGQTVVVCPSRRRQRPTMARRSHRGDGWHRRARQPRTARPGHGVRASGVAPGAARLRRCHRHFGTRHRGRAVEVAHPGF